MFPEHFAETWIDRLTKPGDVVLDPFCGRGTTPFQAILMGREAIGCDINPVAWCVSQSKTNPPTLAAIRRRVTMLEAEFRPKDWESQRRQLPKFFRYAYEPATLRQLLYLRGRLRWRRSKTDCMIAALILGSLHGESNRSSMYLSTHMPHTISTKPAYSVRFWRERGFRPPHRDVFDHIRRMAEFRYESEPVQGRAVIHELDMRELPSVLRGFPPIRCVVTSPPYFDVTNFEEDQWLRLWFLGGPPYATTRRISRDDRHSDADKYWLFIADMWRVFGHILAPEANVVIRFGAIRSTPDEMLRMLTASAAFSGRKVHLVNFDISALKGRQTDAFRPGSRGCRVEIDCWFVVR
ncbi:MAG: site-specific DNA-methyltransferase [Planctomycetes bacterium]|nr:site-specific DNA-methyltransferase [Planctomycetota bacterium]